MTPVTLPAASGIRPRHFTLLTGMIAVLALCYFGYLIAHWSGHAVSAIKITTADTSRKIITGGQTFDVPKDMIQSPPQSLFQTADAESIAAFRLAVVWPSMTAFKSQKIAPPAPLGSGSKIVVVDIEQIKAGETMRDTLGPVYSRLARGGNHRGPAGLQVMTLSRPGDELDQIIFEPGADGFVARCHKVPGDLNAICTGQLTLDGGLGATYRFEKPLLASWGRLERQVTDLVHSLVQSGSAAGSV